MSLSLRRDHLQTESVITKQVTARFGIDVTDIVPRFDDYPRGGRLTTRNVQFGNLQIYATFFPNGEQDIATKDGYCSLFLYVADEKAVSAGTAITATVAFGITPLTFTSLVNQQLASAGYGFRNLCTVAHITQHPVINITLRMRYGSDAVGAETVTHEAEKKMDAFYKFNRMDGDVTLKMVANEDIDATLPQEPPLKKQKLNESESQSESQLDQKENEIKVSSILLKAASPVFRSMLSNDMMEKKEKKITVISESVQNVDDMVYFMCTGKLRDSVNAFQLMKLANFYQMEIFRISCIDRMIETLSVENFVDAVKIFDRYAITKGYTELITFGKVHVEELKNSEKFEELPFSFRMCALEMNKEK